MILAALTEPEAPLQTTEDSREPAGAPASRRHKWTRRLAAVCLGVAVLALAELVLTLSDYDGPVRMFVHVPDGFGGTDFAGNSVAFRGTFSSVPALRAAGRYPSVPPQRFPAAKAPGTCRVLVLGGSSVMGFPFSRNGSFPSFLQTALQAACPQVRFEVVNAGVPALNSFGIMERAGESAGYGADVVVCYTAHNEFYGAYGLASAMPLSRHRGVALAQMWLRRRRLSMAAGDLIATLLPAPPPEDVHRHLAQIMPRLTTVRYEDALYRRARAAFAANLRAIALTARRSGAQVVLCTVACNLRDMPPLGSLHEIGWTEAQEGLWQERVDAAEGLAASGKLDGAVEQLQAAVEMDPGHAGTRFRLARALEALGRPDEALHEYEAARDRDTVRWRAPGDFNQAVRSLVADLHDPAVVLADCERRVAEAAPRGAPGDRLFLDHVHPTVRGNAALARAIAQAIGGSPYGRRLGEWDSAHTLSVADYAHANDLDTLDLVMAYQQAAMLWGQVIGKTDPPAHEYEKCLGSVASLEQDLDDVQRTALERAALGPSSGRYDRLQLLLALGYLKAGLGDKAVAAVAKALRYGEWQVRSAGYAALLLARAKVLSETGHAEDAAGVPVRAKALAPDVAAAAAGRSAGEWLQHLAEGPAPE